MQFGLVFHVVAPTIFLFFEGGGGGSGGGALILCI
jgi:hypothetical protein